MTWDVPYETVDQLLEDDSDDEFGSAGPLTPILQEDYEMVADDGNTAEPRGSAHDSTALEDNGSTGYFNTAVVSSSPAAQR